MWITIVSPHLWHFLDFVGIPSTVDRRPSLQPCQNAIATRIRARDRIADIVQIGLVCFMENGMVDPCESFKGRIRDICRGHDDSGVPVLTPEKCAAYRQRWGVDGSLQNKEPVGSKNEPSLIRKILNFTDAYARYVASGRRDVSDETFTTRTEECRTCDRYNADADLCAECGCKMRVKCRWAVMECPLGRWRAE